MLKNLLILAPLFLITNFSQGQLKIEPDRNVPPSQQYPDDNPSNDVSEGDREETTAERNERIKKRFGDSEAAIILMEEAERSRSELEAELVREKLIQAKDELMKMKSTGISQKKKRQLADAWGRLAKSERLLFGDTTNNLNWLRTAYELDPGNEDIARALDVAERKHEYAQIRLAEAARIRAERNQQD